MMRRCLPLLLFLLLVPVFSLSAKEEKIDPKHCSFKGKPLFDKVQVVKSFPDLKIQVVKSFPDLKVQWVQSFPDACGKWQAVESFPDLKIQYVESFPDLKIQRVESFPGLP